MGYDLVVQRVRELEQVGVMFFNLAHGLFRDADDQVVCIVFMDEIKAEPVFKHDGFYNFRQGKIVAHSDILAVINVHDRKEHGTDPGACHAEASCARDWVDLTVGAERGGGNPPPARVGPFPPLVTIKN